MKIVIVRHADPDYPNNTLTKQGFIEIEALGKYYDASMFDDIYSSPMNRSVLTANAVIKGEKPIQLVDWLIEFHYPFINENGERTSNWDFKPSYINKHPELFTEDYLDCEFFKSIDLKGKYEVVISEFDKVLEKHGYKRNGKFYDVLDSNEKTIVFFCHFGMMTVLMSHLFNVPYTSLAQHMNCQPTGVTTLVSEEREKGIAQFRLLEFGDVSHLKRENIKPSFAGRFCEIFDSDDRH